jgi:hypothetical protein
VFCTLESELVTGALISGQVTVFQSILSRKPKHSFNLYQYSKLSQANNSTNQPTESYHRRGWIFFFQTDEHPIEIVEAACEPGRALYM